MSRYFLKFNATGPCGTETWSCYLCSFVRVIKVSQVTIMEKNDGARESLCVCFSACELQLFNKIFEPHREQLEV